MIMHWEVKAMKRTLVWLLVATLLLTALPAAAEEAATSDVYRTLYSGEITTLNYLVTTTTNDFAISANVIDTLVEYDRLGEVQPSLAESWSTSDDGLVWTFNLRKDATWVDHNGEYYANVTAHDFVAAAKYILNAQNASSSASILYDVIAGAEEYYDGTATPAEGEEPAPVMDWETVGVKAVDDYTLQYTLKNPVPYFLSMTTYVAFMPVNETFLNEMGANFGVATGNDTILYCGAYILSEFAPQEKRVLTKNESNWDADNVFIERIEQTYNKEASTISPELYRRGEIDSASIDSTLAADWLADPETADLIRPVRQSGFYTYFYAFNFDPHFDEQYEPENWKIAVNNENFRKSIFHALDKISAALPYEPDYPETILFDTITPPAFVSLHGEDYTDMGALGEVTAAAQFDEAKALEYKELAIAELTEAGATFPVKIYMPYNPSVTGWDEECQVVEQQMEGLLGTDYIDIIIEAGPTTGFLDAVRRNGNFAIHKCNWGPDYADPNTYTDPFYDGTYNKPEMALYYNNEEGYSEYYALVDAARAITDDLQARYEAFAEAEAFLIEHAFVIPFGFGSGGYDANRLNPFESQYAPFGLSGERYKGQKVYEVPMNTDDYFEAMDAWEAERAALAAQEE